MITYFVLSSDMIHELHSFEMYYNIFRWYKGIQHECVCNYYIELGEALQGVC